MNTGDPIARFQESFDRARTAESFDATRAALATSSHEGVPSVRFVLVKQWDARGFVFYTNVESRKGRELRENPRAALAFHWASIGEQVRVEGPVAPVTAAEADAYFAERPRGSQLGAWASRQSAIIASRAALEASLREVELRFDGGEVPRPPFWSGFRVDPTQIEFWSDRPDRLHDRALYTRHADGWRCERLSP